MVGYWCEFCNCYHSSVSCYHPGRRILAQREAENAKLRADRENIEIENLTGALPGNHEPTVEEIAAAVKLVCDQRDYALETVAQLTAALEQQDGNDG